LFFVVDVDFCDEFVVFDVEVVEVVEVV